MTGIWAKLKINLDKLSMKLNRFIEETFKRLGVFFSAVLILPALLAQYHLIEVVDYREDHLDVHTFQHVWGATLLTIFFIFKGVDIWLAFWFSFLIWVLYEILLDGTKLCNKRGYQLSDIGADFVGAFIPSLLKYLIG